MHEEHLAQSLACRKSAISVSCSYSCCSSVITGKSLILSWPQALGVNIFPPLGGCENQKGGQMGKPSERQVQYRGMEAWGPISRGTRLQEPWKVSPTLVQQTPLSFRTHALGCTDVYRHGPMVPQPGLSPQLPGFHLAGSSFSRLLQGSGHQVFVPRGRRHFSVRYPPMLSGVGVEVWETPETYET